MKLLQNKKGLGLFIIAGMAILIATIILIVSLPDPEVVQSIGIKQYDVLFANEKLEASQIYIDEALPFSARKAFDNLFKTSGIEVDDIYSSKDTYSFCGTHIYPMYTNKDKLSCIPRFSSTYKSYIKQNFNLYLDNYKSFLLNFDYYLDVSTIPLRRTRVLGATSNSASFSLAPNIQYSKKNNVKTYPRGPLGTYGKELRDLCTTGDCFTDLIKHYHALYSAAGYRFPYVYGGESPYTYEDTKKDQEENKKSIFKNIEVTKSQSNNLDLTQEGFDDSGWLWWVGYHAGLKQIEERKTVEEYYESLSKTGKIICKNSQEDAVHCDQLVIIKLAEPGDILFVEENDLPKHVMIYLGDEEISHSRENQGLLKESIPSIYVDSKVSHILAVIRPKYSKSTQQSIFGSVATSEDDSGEISNCKLPVVFNQINQSAIRSSRKAIINDPNYAFTSLNKILVETNQLNTLLAASSTFSRISPEVIKSIMITEIGYGSGARTFLLGKKEKRNIAGPMQIGRAACEGVNKQHKTIICDHKLIESGTYEGAANGILSGAAYLDVLLTKYLDPQHPNYFFLALAYNAGPTTMKNVLKEVAARKSISTTEVEWSDVTKEDIRKGATWADEAKVVEIFEYPNLVVFALSQQCEGDFLAAYSVSGSKMDFKPVFSTTTPMDLEALKQVEEFAIDVATCNNKLIDCVEKKVIAFNKKNKNENGFIVRIDLQGETDSAGYELVDQMLNCYKNEQTNCICKISLDNVDTTSQNFIEESISPYYTSKPADYFGEINDDINRISFSKENTLLQLDESGNVKLGFIGESANAVFIPTTTLFTFPFQASQLSGNESSTPLFLQLDVEKGEHILTKKLTTRTSFMWTVGKDMDSLAIAKDGDFSIKIIEANQRQKQIVNYATQYLGTGYHDSDIDGTLYDCSASRAIRNECKTQCGSFLSSVFSYTFHDADMVPRGYGAIKCDHATMRKISRGTELFIGEQLQPGDFFASSGGSKYGHTGMFVGFGEVRTNARKSSSYCYKEFIPKENGEPVFIHSVGPVCYNTLSQITKNQKRKIYSFCRHTLLENTKEEKLESVEKETTTTTSISPKSAVVTSVETVTKTTTSPPLSSTVHTSSSLVSDSNLQPDYPLAKFPQLLKYLERNAEVTYIVNHYTVSNTVESARVALINRSLSYHYIIDKDGEVYQFVPESKSAQHAGCPPEKPCWLAGMNSKSIGISFVNCGFDETSCQSKTATCFETENNNLCWEIYTEAQINSYVNLVADIMTRHKGLVLDNKIIAERVIPHSAVRPGKSDPGPVFDSIVPDLIPRINDVYLNGPKYVEKKSYAPMEWMKYEESLHANNLCRENKHYFRFKVNFGFTEKSFGFSIYLNDTEPPSDGFMKTHKLRKCGSADTPVLSWHIPHDFESIYSFEIHIQNESVGAQKTIFVNASTAKLTDTKDITSLTQIHQLYKREGSTSTEYIYLTNKFKEQVFSPGGLYEFNVVSVDHYLNKYPLSSNFISIKIPSTNAIVSELDAEEIVDVVQSLFGECNDTLNYDTRFSILDVYGGINPSELLETAKDTISDIITSAKDLAFSYIDPVKEYFLSDSQKAALIAKYDSVGGIKPMWYILEKIYSDPRASTAYHIIIDGENQEAYLIHNEIKVKIGSISTATLGFSEKFGSYQTPRGLFGVQSVIGTGVPKGTVFVVKKPVMVGDQYKIVEIHTTEYDGTDDSVLSRVIALNGEEEFNKNTFSRLVYLHGTNEEGLLGSPASHGCLRFSNDEMISLADNYLTENSKIYIAESIDFETTLTDLQLIDIQSVTPEQSLG